LVLTLTRQITCRSRIFWMFGLIQVRPIVLCLSQMRRRLGQQIYTSKALINIVDGFTHHF